MSPVLLKGASHGRGVVWCESRFEVLGLGFSWEWRSSPQKGSCIWDLTAQASGQALIRSSESSGSASCSVFPSVYATPPLSRSPLFFTSVFICSLQICRFLPSSASGFAPSLKPSEGDVSPRSRHRKIWLFSSAGFHLGWLCILINILCVFAWVCGMTSYYHNSGGAFAITSARLCVLQM